MQIVQDVPLIHMMPAQQGGSTARMNADIVQSSGVNGFLATLQSLLGNEQEIPADHSELAEQLHHMLKAMLTTPDTLDSAMMTEEEQVLLTSLLISAFMQSTMEEQQNLQQNEGLNQWLLQAQTLLAGAVSEPGFSAAQQHAQNAAPDEILYNAQTHQRSQQDAMHKGLLEFLKALQQHPDNDQLKAHAVQLQQLLKPLIAERPFTDLLNPKLLKSALLPLQQQTMQALTSSELLQTLQRVMEQAGKLEQAGIPSSSARGVFGSAQSFTPSFYMEQGHSNAVQTAASAAAGTTIPITSELASAVQDNSLFSVSIQDAARHVEMTGRQTQSANQPSLLHVQQFAEQASSLFIKHFNIAQAKGFSEVRISLVPEQLGHVNIQISMQNGHMVAHLIADSVMGKELLESQLNQLRVMLQSQGIQVDKLEVSQSQSYAGLFQDQQRQSAFQHKNQAKHFGSYDQDFTLEFDDAESVMRQLYGTSFEASV